jgi:hypothetical protein
MNKKYTMISIQTMGFSKMLMIMLLDVYNKVVIIRYEFNVNIIATNIMDISVVVFLLTNSPITALFLEIKTSGTTGKGISKLRTT